jgi:arsenate reductase
MKPNLLVLCNANDALSQLTEAWLRHYLGKHVEVFSAGINPEEVHPFAIKVMKELGMDISMHTANDAADYLHLQFDTVITVSDSARENCPWYPMEVKRVHTSFTDPSKISGSEEERLYQFRKVRDQIREWCHRFATRYMDSLK